ncbi:MAG TPA: response regulator [Intrasporangium sp.]|uniref:response regulator transcription factor n=1 Tax=Intrasporangium sp. TaxID=1925024 RepID=UPI002D77F96F|nr:response regulator [Intrasporangium sp.]HET7397874.1 response regulator [Intrasporangium sp.]
MPDTLLIAEDDHLVVRLLRATFAPTGLRLLTVGTGSEALEVARAERPDAVILDVGLPDLDGYEVCRRLRSAPETASILVVMLSARAADSDQERGTRAGAALYLTKPFSPSELRAAVQGLLEQPRPR